MGKYTIRTNEAEDRMMESLQKALGYRKYEVFRTALRELHRKEIPPYTIPKKDKIKSPLDELSDEEYCKQVHGGVLEGDFCIIRKGSLETRIPINIMRN
jgi:hypothetical protein